MDYLMSSIFISTHGNPLNYVYDAEFFTVDITVRSDFKSTQHINVPENILS